MRLTKSFTVEPEVHEYIEATKGDGSVSERVNRLLKLAIQQERYEALEAEATVFFSGARTERYEAAAFQKAALRTFSRA